MKIEYSDHQLFYETFHAQENYKKWNFCEQNFSFLNNRTAEHL